MKNIILYLCILPFLVSCLGGSGSKKAHLPESVGDSYDVVVISPKKVWEGLVGDTLRYELQKDVPMINQIEPQFDLVNFYPEYYKGLVVKYRNIIIVNVDSTVNTPSVKVDTNAYASPQIVVTFSASSDSAMVNLINRNGENLAQLLNIAERDRYVQRTKKLNNIAVSDSIKKYFNINIDIPKGFKIRTIRKPDFMWISYETALTSQGIFIYSYSASQADMNSAEVLTMRRNEFASLIPGPSENSFMVTSDVFLPQMSRYTINGHPWVELKGLWEVDNDFMGGPFVSYSTIDTLTRRVITIDEYVYSPKYTKPKRNLIKQLESLVYSVSFDK